MQTALHNSKVNFSGYYVDNNDLIEYTVRKVLLNAAKDHLANLEKERKERDRDYQLSNKRLDLDILKRKPKYHSTLAALGLFGTLLGCCATYLTLEASLPVVEKATLMDIINTGPVLLATSIATAFTVFQTITGIGSKFKIPKVTKELKTLEAKFA